MTTINGTNADETLSGTAEDDTIHAAGGVDTVSAGNGDDVIHGGAGRDRLYGENGNDSIYGGDDGDVVVGGAGQDELYGESGDDYLFGGGDSDRLFGGVGSDILTGDNGHDELYGGEGDDSLVGGNGNDLLDGGTGTNTLDGGSGNDTFAVDGGVNAIEGGTGLDTLQLHLTASQVAGALSDLETLRTFMENNLASVGGDINILATQISAPTVVLGDLGIVLSNVEQVEIFVDGTVTSFEDLLGPSSNSGGNGGPVDPTIYGTEGNDDLTGTANDDLFEAGNGNDFVEAGDGADEVYGGDGNDRLYGERDNDTLYGGGGRDTLVGGHGDDHIYGGDDTDYIFAGGDHDTVFGEAGNDIIAGDAGNDIIDGGAGDDTVYGRTGNDQLVHTVGEGHDTLNGNTGTDTLVLNLLSSSVAQARDNLQSLVDWMAGNLDAVGGDEAALARQDNTNTLDLYELGVSLSNIERLIVKVDGNETNVNDLLNQAPEADALVLMSAREDENYNGQIVATDGDGDTLSYTMLTLPSSGTVQLDEQTGTFSFLSNSNEAGTTSFVVRISDPSGEYVDQTIELSVDAVADGPRLDAPNTLTAIRTGEIIQGTSGNDVLEGDGFGGEVKLDLDLEAALTDIDGSETLSIMVRGLPTDATLSAGTRLPDGRVELVPSELNGLQLTINGNSSFDLDITATATEISNGDVATVTKTVSVVVDNTAAVNNTIYGGNGNDTIRGLTGNDTLDGGNGNDRVYGDSGDDTIIGSRGNDYLYGGDGFDTLDYSQASRYVIAYLRADYVSGMDFDRVDGFEKVIGSKHNDILIGDNTDNVLIGGAGHDRIYSLNGNNELDGGEGND